MTAQIHVKVPDVDLPIPVAANWFHFRHHMGDVEMLVGYVGAGAIERVTPQLMSGTANPIVEPELTGRVLVQLTGFLHLRAQVEDLYKKMQEAGVFDGIPDQKNG